MTTTIQAVIFDFGGVLMRTADPVGRREWEARLKLPAGELERVVHGSTSWIQAQRGERSVETYWRDVAQALKLPEAEIPALRRDYFHDDHLDHEMITLISRLRERGYKVGLLSNDALTLESKLRDELGIYDAFDAVIISAQIGIMKPDPGAYAAAAQALAVPLTACVFIDDNRANTEGARLVGMQTIYYQAGMDVQSALDPLLA